MRHDGAGKRDIPWGFLALGGALALAMGLFVVQSGWPDGDDQQPTTGGARGAATATADATVQVQVLPPTATVADVAAVSTAGVVNAACAQGSRLSGRPSGLLVNDPTFPVWFGEAGSELAVAPIGLAGLNPALSDTDAHWFAEGPQPVLWFGAEDPLTIDGTLLDDGRAGRADGFHASDGIVLDQFSQKLTMTFPVAGCWMVTASSGALSTSFPVLVAPFAQRPDVLAATSERSAQPYAPPADCADPAWTGPSDPLGILSAAWWIAPESAGDTAALGSGSAVFWAGMESEFLLRAEDDPTRVYSIDATAVDGSRLTATAIRMAPGQWRWMLPFSQPGCWEVRVSNGSTTLVSVRVFVFPMDCRRESATIPVPDTCTVLAGNP